MKPSAPALPAIFASLLACTSAPAPVPGASLPCVGIIAAARGAYVGNAEASGGTTLYDGDRLATSEHGWLRVTGQGLQFQLSSETIAFLHESASAERDNSSIALVSGAIDVAAQSARFQILAQGAALTPAHGRPALVHIEIHGGREMHVTVHRGEVEFAYRSQRAVLHESQAYAVVLDPTEKEIELATSFATENPEPEPGARKPLFLLILIFAAAAAGIPLLLHALESPDHP